MWSCFPETFIPFAFCIYSLVFCCVVLWRNGLWFQSSKICKWSILRMFCPFRSFLLGGGKANHSFRSIADFKNFRKGYAESSKTITDFIDCPVTLILIRIFYVTFAAMSALFMSCLVSMNVLTFNNANTELRYKIISRYYRFWVSNLTLLGRWTPRPNIKQ